MHTVGPGICQETLTTWKMRNAHSRTWNVARKPKIVENEKHTLGRDICRENLKNVKKEKYTLYDLDYGEKPEKHGK
jgi:hypothetical protein